MRDANIQAEIEHGLKVVANDERADRLESYINDNRDRSNLELLEDGGATEIVDALYNFIAADDKINLAFKANGETCAKYMKALFFKGKMNTPEYADLGRAFAAWVIAANEEGVRFELEKEFDEL